MLLARSVPVALLATLVLLPSATSAPARPAAKHACAGTYASTSIYKRARVVVVRGVSCGTAVGVARAYDKRGRVSGGWRCGLAHGGGTRLFSCGKGLRGGSLTNARSAFVAYGSGARRAAG